MNYETATDFELNKALAYLRFNKFTIGESFIFSTKKKIVRVGCSAREYGDTFDPCNNWSDIMPIAVELGVYYTPTGDFTAVQKMGDDYSYFGYTQSSTPQRALVICCIKVLEAQK